MHSTDEKKNDPRRRAPASLGCHDPATPNAHGATPPSHRTSLALWRLILVRDVQFGGAVLFFFCAALKNARLYVACRGGQRVLRKAARSADLAWGRAALRSFHIGLM